MGPWRQCDGTIRGSESKATMRQLRTIVPFVLLAIALLVWGDAEQMHARPNPATALEIMTPGTKKVLMKENVMALAGRVIDPSVATVTLYRSISAVKMFRMKAETRQQFTDWIGQQIWTDDAVGASIRIVFRPRGGDSVAIADSWGFESLPTRQQFWQLDAGKKVLDQLNEMLEASITVSFTGWLTGDAILSTNGTGERWFNSMFYLSAGNNTAIIVAHRADKSVVEIDSVGAYYNIDNVADQPGEGFEKFTFHNTPTEAACRTCHKPKPYTARDACAPCHDGMWNQRYTHTPTKQRRCMACHDSTSPNFAIQKSLGSDADLCYTCHTKQKELWNADTMKRHAPVDGGTCVQCHTPHSSPTYQHTDAPINRICSSCHNDKPEFLHPIVGHPHRGVPEGGRKGIELSCAGCHNPHASVYDKLSRYGNEMEMCQGCHPK